jgi:4-amino-4-deoxychorismate lyase
MLFDGKKIRNLELHNQRANKTIRENFKKDINLDLETALKNPPKEPCRVKIIYSDAVQKVEYHPIIQREWRSFKIIDSDIEYPYKYVDRSHIERLYEKREDCDEIIIVKDDLLRDCSIANIAIFNESKWITPKLPLLKGTMRESLLKKQIILEKDVKIEHLKNAKKIALLNAIVGFYVIDDFTLKGL